MHMNKNQANLKGLLQTMTDVDVKGKLMTVIPQSHCLVMVLQLLVTVVLYLGTVVPLLVTVVP